MPTTISVAPRRCCEEADRPDEPPLRADGYLAFDDRQTPASMRSASGTEVLARLVDEAARSTSEGTALRDRYRGVMLGLAAGNALGLPVEGSSAHSIRRRFPHGVTDVDPAERERPLDDDVAQAVILAEVLCETEALDPQMVGSRLVLWARENGRGMGGLTHSVIRELERGAEPYEAARRAWERNPMSGAGNGAVMRCPPVALRHLTSGPDLVEAARRSALVTHYDARCEWSTVAVAIAVATCLGGVPVGLDQLAGAFDDLGEDVAPREAVEQVSEAIRAVDGAGLDSLPLDDPMDMGYTLKAMQVALWCVAERPETEQAVIGVVNRGGDTDTNGAVAGAVLGALHGTSSIPPRWLDNLAGGSRLTELADRLLEASGAL